MKLMGFNIKKAQATLKKIQHLSNFEFDDWQDKKKWSIVKYHFNENAFYKNKIGKNIPTKWEDLPVMEKSDLQINLKKLLSNDYNLKNVFIGNTSGSSGQPFYYAKNKFSHSMTWALSIDRYGWHNLQLDSKQARFYGVTLRNPGKSFELIKDKILNRKRFNIFNLSEKKYVSFINYFKNSKFQYVYGYTNSLVLFSNYLIKHNIILKDICPSLKVCIITSEVLSKEDRLLLLKGFGLEIINEYGVSEAGGIVAFQNKKLDWKLSKETQFIEIINKDNFSDTNSGLGEILITDLFNQAMPIIRYKVGDIGSLEKVKNSYCLKKLLGRINDNIILPDGTVSPGLTFYYISKSTLEKSGILKEFIIRQINIDTFIFDIVADRDLNKKEIANIQHDLDLYLQPNLKLIVNRVSKIKRLESGKTKHFFSELDDREY